MTIIWREITSPMDGELLRVNIGITGPQIEQFKQLLNRALNTWYEAPWELKEFADIAIYGKPLQEYENQAASASLTTTEQKQQGEQK